LIVRKRAYRRGQRDSSRKRYGSVTFSMCKEVKRSRERKIEGHHIKKNLQHNKNKGN
jgi:hypothetical protein